jgi:hypothetical protein
MAEAEPHRPGVVLGQDNRGLGNLLMHSPFWKGVLLLIINAECLTIEGNGTTEEQLLACAKGFLRRE